jgi:hypothetical protein
MGQPASSKPVGLCAVLNPPTVPVPGQAAVSGLGHSFPETGARARIDVSGSRPPTAGVNDRTLGSPGVGTTCPDGQIHAERLSGFPGRGWCPPASPEKPPRRTRELDRRAPSPLGRRSHWGTTRPISHQAACGFARCSMAAAKSAKNSFARPGSPRSATFMATSSDSAATHQ